MKKNVYENRKCRILLFDLFKDFCLLCFVKHLHHDYINLYLCVKINNNILDGDGVGNGGSYKLQKYILLKKKNIHITKQVEMLRSTKSNVDIVYMVSTSQGRKVTTFNAIQGDSISLTKKN